MCIPNYFSERGLETSFDWFQHQQALADSRYGSNNDFFVSHEFICDLNTRVNMADFHFLPQKTRVYAIMTTIPREGVIDVAIHLHKDA